MSIDQIDNYNYPLIVKKIIHDFVEIVIDVFKKENPGVLLIGSTSRGELCWGCTGNDVTLFSDIEFMISVNSISADKRKTLFNRIDNLCRSHNLGGRFHFDYTLIRWDKLSRLDKRIIIFDSKNCGIDLTDNFVSQYLPDVTKENINFHELNDVLLHRMKSIVNDVPEDIFNEGKSHNEFVLSIAKNTLDITTWLFPYEASGLVSGFSNRLKIWENNRQNIKLSDYFDDFDYDYLNECLHVRKYPLRTYDYKSMLVKYIRIYEKAINYCKYMNGISESSQLCNQEVSRKLFLEYKIRRRVKEAINMTMNYRMFTLVTLLRNIVFSRKGRQVICCTHMIKSLVAHFSTDEETKMQELILAENSLRKFVKFEKKESAVFSESWLSLMKRYKEFNKVVI